MKILTRYIIDQVLRSFLLALVTITSIFVLFMVMAEASRAGLAPGEILRIIPYIIPSSLPYTIPVALLFSVSVVYGRIASDNEIIAIKSAGVDVLRVLVPAWMLGAALTGGLLWAGTDMIPRATHEFRRVLFQDFEDMLYKVLKKEGEFKGMNGPFYISAQDVDGRTLIGAIFRHRTKDKANEFDMTISAERARIRFDVPNKLVRVDLENSQTTGTSEKPFVFEVQGRKELQWPMPKDQSYKLEPPIQALTDAQIRAQQAALRKQVAQERLRQAAAASMWIASGRIERVTWPEVGAAYKDFPYWQKKIDELETERQLRRSLALGAILFIWIGAPVGVLFARRDFLSAFISCFLPIIVVYYPLILGGVNMAKEGTLRWHAVYYGDVLLFAAGILFIRRVRRH